MKFIRNTTRNRHTAGELLGFFGRNKRWWLVPILVCLFLLGALIVVARVRRWRLLFIRCSSGYRLRPGFPARLEALFCMRNM